MRESLTLCVSLKGRPIGVKTWRPGSDTPDKLLDKPRLMRLEHREVWDFPSWVQALEQLSGEPDRFPVRGDLVGPVTDIPQRRLLVAQEGDEATLRDAPKRQLLLDLDVKPDEFPPPDWPMTSHYAAEVWERVGVLVPELRGAEAWWSFTASAGVKPGVRMRFAVWMAEPRSCEELRTWCKELKERVGFALFDPAIYTANQPSYCAPPLFTQGMVDPITQRSGVLPGSPCGPLPAPTRHDVRMKPTGVVLQGEPIPLGDAPLLPPRAEDWLRTLAPGNFRAPIKAAVSLSARDGCDPQAVVSRILEAVDARGGGDRFAYWERELPRMVKWVWDQEAARRAKELAQAVPHPGCETAAVPLGEAERLLGEAARDWARRALECATQLHNPATLPFTAPPRVLVNVTVGVGKTRAAVEAIARLLRDRGGGLSKVAYLVPTHRLGDELVDRFSEAGVLARLWRGASSSDADGTPMCDEPAVLEEAKKAGVDQSTACGRCPAKKVCRYQAQAKQPAQVWIGVHEFLFRTPPKVFSDAQALVVDESFWAAGVQQKRVTFEQLRGDLLPLKGDPAVQLGDLRAELLDRLQEAPEGAPIDKARTAGWSIQGASMDTAHDLEWRRAPKADSLPPAGGSADALREALAGIAKAGRFSSAIPKLWKLLQEVAETPADERKSGFVDRRGEGVEVRYRREVAKAWQGLPMLLLDGSAERSLVEALLGPVELVEVRAELPQAVHITQVWDEAMARNALHRKPQEGGEGRDVWRAGNRRDLVALLKVEAERQPAGARRVEAILQKGPKELLVAESGEELERLKVGLRHFNALRGLDGLRDTPTLVVIGRPMPPPRDVEATAEVLFGRRRTTSGGGRTTRLVTLTPRDGGRGEAVEVPCHTDPGAEAVRRAICDAELAQAVGRARCVRRTEATPLRIVLVTNHPVPGLQPDALVRWKDLKPNKWEQIAARLGGVLPLSPRDLVAVGGFETEEGAKRALARLKGGGKGVLMGTPPYKETLNRGMYPFNLTYTYRLKGQRGRPSMALGPQDEPTTRRLLEGLLGPLALLSACEAAATAAELKAAAPRAAIVTSGEQAGDHPADHPECSRNLTPAEPRGLREEPPQHPTRSPGSMAEELIRGGSSPLNLARRCGVSEERLRRAVEKLKKRYMGPTAAPETRAAMKVREAAGVLPYWALFDLVPPETMEAAVHGAALAALERRDRAAQYA